MAKTSKSKRIFQVILLTSTAISLFFVPWSILWVRLKTLPDSVKGQIEQTIDQGHFAGMIVYVDEGGKDPEFYAAGWHNKEQKIKAYPEALFKIASVGKLYVAATITKLVGDGKIDLDQSLAYYMPELEGRIENAASITIRQMVGHISGIPSYTETPGYWSAPKETFEENLALVLDQPAKFEPGKDYHYSNTNYLLLDEIMNRILGYTNFLYLKQEILEPLGLQNTHASVHHVDLDSLMSGYYVGYEGDLRTDNLGIVATAEDVGIFLRALNEGSFFEGKEQEIYSSIYVYDHTGLAPGYQTYAEYNEDLDTVVIQFLNTTDFSGYHWSYGRIALSRIMKIVKRRH